MDRIATFKSFIQRAPGDPFPRYGLAMEHKGRGELAEAWTVFSELLAQFPDYVPTYLMAGGTLVALGRRDEAADVYQRGLDAARSTTGGTLGDDPGGTGPGNQNQRRGGDQIGGKRRDIEHGGATRRNETRSLRRSAAPAKSLPGMQRPSP